jgi:hypothetical protein
VPFHSQRRRFLLSRHCSHQCMAHLMFFPPWHTLCDAFGGKTRLRPPLMRLFVSHTFRKALPQRLFAGKAQRCEKSSILQRKETTPFPLVRGVLHNDATRYSVGFLFCTVSLFQQLSMLSGPCYFRNQGRKAASHNDHPPGQGPKFHRISQKVEVRCATSHPHVLPIVLQ